MSVNGLYSAAFFESDPRKIVEAGFALLPAESSYGQIIADTLRWSEEHPTDWTLSCSARPPVNANSK